MSNFIVTGGLAGPLVVTQGWGSFAPVPTGSAIIKFDVGDLLINIEIVGDEAFLVFQDGINDIRQQLPFSAEQAAGIGWAIIKIKRVGSNLIIQCDKTELSPIPIVHRNYGGQVTIMDGRDGHLFDLRVINKNVTKEATDYYIDDLTENNGDAFMPRR